jgi:hypothetical protein
MVSRRQRTARRNLMAPQITLSNVSSGIVLNFSGDWISMVLRAVQPVAEESSPMH